MATAVSIPVEQYLATMYRPDCDYIDGEVEERNLGEQSHGLIQTMLSTLFVQQRRAWGLRPITELRVQVRPGRFRIPDVCVVPAQQPLEEVLYTAPLLCIEVLSPEDRFSRILERVEDYLAMGVPVVWIIDPRSRDIWTVRADGRPVLFTGAELTLEGTPARIDVKEIFALIDEAPPAAQV